MIERALDSNNDILIRNGSFATVNEGEQTVQFVRTRLLFYFGEWFLDKRVGTPWFQEIFVKPFNPGLVENIIKSRIANTEGVKEIIEFSMELLNPETRKLKISFSAETDYGILNKQEIYIND